MSKTGRVILSLGAGGLVLLLLVGVGIWVVLPRMVLSEIERQAAEMGVELVGCRLQLGTDELVLTECSMTLSDSPEVEGELGEVRIGLEHWEAQNIAVQGARVRIKRLPGVPALEQLNHLVNLRQQHRSPVPIPWQVSDSQLHWFSGGRLEPLVSLTELGFDSKTEALAAALRVGKWLGGKVKHQGSDTQIDLNSLEQPEVTGRIRVEQKSADEAQLRIEVKKLPLGEIAEPLIGHMPAAVSDVSVSGQMFAQVPLGLSKAGVRGDFRASLSRLALPVPAALGGLVQRESGIISGDYRLAPNNMELELSKLTVAVGALTMRGTARARVAGLSAPFDGRLRGALSCGAIIEAATRAQTDSPIAHAASRIARQAIQGSVTISLLAQGNLLDTASWKAEQRVSAGCGLKQEVTQVLDRATGTLEDLSGLKLPDLAAELEQGLKSPKLKERLDRLPKLELPRLPRLPKRAADSLGDTPAPGGDMPAQPKAPQPKTSGPQPSAAQPSP